MAIDVPISGKASLILVFALGVVVLWVLTITTGGLVIGVILLAIAIYILYIVAIRIHDRLTKRGGYR